VIAASHFAERNVGPMIFTSTTEYAIRGLSELASRSTGGSMLLDQLVAGTDLPRDFMAKIFQRLVKGRLLRSAKGRGGGFTLARPAHEITLMNIVEAIEGPQRLDQSSLGWRSAPTSCLAPSTTCTSPFASGSKIT